MYRAVNASGTFFNNYFQKPPLAAEVVDASRLEASGYSPHDSREYLEELICSFTGCGDVFVFNNVYAALSCVLEALDGKEIIVPSANIARGDFSPLFIELLKNSRLTWKTVGQKSQLHLEDYKDSLRQGRSILLKVDNWGNTRLRECFQDDLNEKLEIPVVSFPGDVSLVDMRPYGLENVFPLYDLHKRQDDIVVFGGNRLLGGPPVGIVVGKPYFIRKLREEFGSLAFSPGKSDYLAMEATLRLYKEPEEALDKIPLLRMVSMPLQKVEERAQKFLEQLQSICDEKTKLRLTREKALISAGSDASLPSCQLAVRVAGFTSQHIADLLHKRSPSIHCRTNRGEVLFDFRTIPQEDEPLLLEAFREFYQELSGQERFFLNHVPTLIWALDTGGNIIFVNKSAQDFFGKKFESVEGKKIDQLVSPQEAQQLQEALNKVLIGNKGCRLEMQVESRLRSKRWLEVHLSPAFTDNRVVDSITFTANDITEHKMSEEELKRISMHDTLTGLYNRHYFEEELEKLDSSRYYPISIIMCDIDGLQLVNNVMGHDMGDELIKKAAEIIKKPFRSSDVVARLGGDEFAVILPETSQETAREICSRVKDAVAEYNKANRKEKGFYLSISVGSATGKDRDEGIRKILKAADSEMFNDKAHRSEQVRFKLFESFIAQLEEMDLRDIRYQKKLENIILLLSRAIGLLPKEIEKILYLSRIYDIGKVSLFGSGLLSKKKLEKRDWEKLRRHPEMGYYIALSVPRASEVADYILQHHEWWNGDGYPRGLKGEDIHLYARIIALADAYTSITSPRPYRSAFSHGKAIEELKKERGRHFDPNLVDIFVSLMEDMDYDEQSVG
ncbi:MAG: diguanylate cyclase [Firmicutes bacterium]|nr:diguanylate cyclase [Bacillota bacterium]